MVSLPEETPVKGLIASVNVTRESDSYILRFDVITNADGTKVMYNNGTVSTVSKDEAMAVFIDLFENKYAVQYELDINIGPEDSIVYNGQKAEFIISQ